jgi:hypothetical protein
MTGRAAKLLKLLMTKFPATRRIVVTASAPVGSLRAGVFEKYQLDDLIIKGKATVPGLQMVVERVLQNDIHRNPQPFDYHEPRTTERDWRVNYRKSELTERYRDWHDGVAEEIRNKIRYAENRVRDAGRYGPREVAAARTILNGWLAVRTTFTAACAMLDSLIITVITIDDVLSATQRLEQVVIEIASKMTALQFSGRAR